MISTATRHLRRHAIAYVAVFLALGGTAYAGSTLGANSVGTKQLKNGAVTLRKISSGAQASLRGQVGAQGPQGPQGTSGIVSVPLSGPIVGPLPNTAIQFNKRQSNTDLLVTISGTGYRSTTQGPGIGVLTLLIDGVDKGNTAFYFNNTLVHETFPTAQIVVSGLAAGAHTLQLTGSNVTTDGTDFYRVTALEVTTG
jgi:hypothetical protein